MEIRASGSAFQERRVLFWAVPGTTRGLLNCMERRNVPTTFSGVSGLTVMLSIDTLTGGVLLLSEGRAKTEMEKRICAVALGFIASISKNDWLAILGSNQ